MPLQRRDKNAARALRVRSFRLPSLSLKTRYSVTHTDRCGCFTSNKTAPTWPPSVHFYRRTYPCTASNRSGRPASLFLLPLRSAFIPPLTRYLHGLHRVHNFEFVATWRAGYTYGVDIWIKIWKPHCNGPLFGGHFPHFIASCFICLILGHGDSGLGCCYRLLGCCYRYISCLTVASFGGNWHHAQSGPSLVARLDCWQEIVTARAGDNISKI